ncbi:hypothetical protein Misp02_42160 [Microtetraspora sp. NBRC 16547]|nr:hypothetical protein Misp02_42160 [Microtetraspora sp. NBRC 16547]
MPRFLTRHLRLGRVLLRMAAGPPPTTKCAVVRHLRAALDLVAKSGAALYETPVRAMLARVR